MEKKKVLLSVKDLHVKFRVRGRILTAIRGISLDIYEGESIAIVGESGSGKSVFTKTFAGMLEQNGFIDEGSIIYNDEALADTNVALGNSQKALILSTWKKLNQYSKLISKVRLRSVSGHARQNIVGKIPEGIWMEMSGALNSLEFRITDIETDGFKVGGFIPIDNYILKDTDIALGEEILYMLGQSIGYAVDKAIVFGLGPNSRMPVGWMTRLGQTAKPAYWGDNQGEWIDLSGTNVLKLNLASLDGTAFFVPLLSALAKAKPTYATDGLIWVMNDATKKDIQIRALSFNINAALVSGLENTMPVIGGEIITLEFMPDHMITGGYAGEYLLVEREGGTFGSSDAPLYLLDKTVFKGTARYDGQPVSGEAFVGVTYDNTAVTVAMKFATDYANTPANALVVTSAAGASGKTILTVAGAVNASNTLKAFVGAPVAIVKGAEPDGHWTEIESGTTAIAAKTGAGATVVELDEHGKVISIGYCASVTAGV